MHKKREAVSKTWPITRKGSKFIVLPSHGGENEIPILVLLRDVLKHVQTRKELNKILKEKKILVNNKVIREDNYSVTLFDTISLKDLNKFYRVTYLENRKIGIEEITEKECGEKIAKIKGKKSLKGKKTQVNLSDGRNFIYESKIAVGDSVLVNVEKKKIVDIIPIKKGSEVLVIKGKHLGKRGSVEEIDDGEKAVIKTGKENIEIKLMELISIK